jgi:nucleoid-associated protein EbfC
MFKNIANMGGLLKQAQDMQAKMEKMQSELETITVDGTSGAGLVTVTMTVKGNVKSIKIDDSLIKIEDKEILEDLIITAMNDARKRADERSAAEMEKITGGFNLPAGFKLPF